MPGWTNKTFKRALMLFCLSAQGVVSLPIPMYAQANSATFHNLPICATSGAQNEPLLLPGPDNGAYVLWEDARAARAAIYCQRVDSLGHPQWQSNGIAVATTSGRQTRFSAANDGNGGLFIVWQEVTSDDGDILGQRINAAGERMWGEGGKEIFSSNKEQGFPRLVADGEGGAFVVWEDERTGSQDIAGQRVNANGERLWNAASVELVNTRRTQTLNDVVAVPRHGFIVAWQDDNSNPARVLVQYFDASGKGVWADPVWVGQSSGEQGDARMVLESKAANDFALYIVWLDRRVAAPNVYAQKIAVNGALLWGNSGVAAGFSVAAQSEAQLLLEGNGGLYAVWKDARNDKGDIYAQRIQHNGLPAWSALGLPLAKLEQEQSRPRLAFDGQGGLVSVWEDERGSGTNIYVQRMNAQSAALWNAEGVVLTNHGKKNSQPYALARTPERSWFAWTDERNGNEDIFTQPLGATGSFKNIPPRFLSQPASLATIGTPYEYVVNAVDYDSEEVPALEMLTGPAWLQLNQAARKLQGTPQVSDSGTVRVELRALDLEGGSTLQSFQLQIRSDVTQPQILSKPDTLAREDMRYVYQITARDPDPRETLRYSLESNAAWLALSPQGELAGTPLNEHVGVFSVKIIATNGKGKAAEQQFKLRVENTNDPPLFIGTPDTAAFADSTFIYKPLVQDVDLGDRVTLTLLAAPAWSTWDATARTLRGVPTFRDVGVAQISFRAEDLAGAVALQNATVRVYDRAAPDHNAPPAPQNLTITPSRWSTAPQFTVRWQNPFDPSAIAGAYYKAGKAPDSSRDGTFVKASSSGPAQEFSLQAAREGTAPIFVWLIDGRDNVDHRTARRVDYHYDRTPPEEPLGLRVHAFNRGPWVRGDTTRFSWRASVDTLSGIASYTFNIDDNVVAQLTAKDTSFALINLLQEGSHTCQVVAVDSAGNRKASLRSTFRVDRTAPRITHVPRDTVRFGAALELRATASDAASGVAGANLLYRAAGQTQFLSREMSLQNDEFAASLAYAEISTAGLEYAIAVYDSAGNAAISAQTTRGVHAVVVGSAQLAAPFATRGESYQVISVPYRLDSDSTLSWLRDDFGTYEPTEWRLYSYHAANGNIEFGHAGFATFVPGRALWLITAKSQRFDLGPAHSISTAQDFALQLQPGWNLIATPFDFPTDWEGVQKPPLVESQLWAFDGRQYVGGNTVMQPWQGYFVRNLNSSVETIVLAPRCGNCDPNFKKVTEELAASTIWRMRLHVSNDEFADHDNWLGVSAEAEEEWDRLDWSEPPVAPGDFAVLRFDQRHWPRFAGLFTTDFRPPALHAQKWRFEISCGAENRSVKLWLDRFGDTPNEHRFILEEENTGFTRVLTFDERTNATSPITFRGSLAPRRFVLWVGSKEQLMQEGVVARATPEAYQLWPVYPNPAHRKGSEEVLSTLRFSLPQAGEIDLRIYDVLGRQVRALLLNQTYEPGHYEILWDGKDDNSRAVAAGVYLYRMSTANFQATRKLIVIND